MSQHVYTNGTNGHTNESHHITVDTTPLIHSGNSNNTEDHPTPPPASLSSDDIINNHDALPFTTRFGYAVGHVLNDLTASCWFSYLLTYFRRVLLLRQPYAGVLLLIGQVADAVATPVVGYLSDKSRNHNHSIDLSPSFPLLSHHNSSHEPAKRYGRKAWIMCGMLCVAVSFPFIFHTDIFNSTSLTAKVLYFTFFVIIFQFSWATTQVSHLALVPELTPVDSERVYLNSLRSCFTILCNITVYCLAFLLLHTQSIDSNLGPSDQNSFFLLACIVTAIGIVFSVVFIVYVPEPVVRPKAHGSVHMNWSNWFLNVQFYQTALVYMCTRVMVNVSQVYMPLWLIQTLNAPKTSIATMPLLMFCSGFVSTLLSEKLTKQYGSILLTVIGCGFILLSSFIVYSSCDYGILTYCVALSLGIGSGIVSVSALSLICNLVGESCESSAFVFGAMSFVDKMANGILIMIAEYMTPVDESRVSSFYQDVLSGYSGTAALIAIAMLCTMLFYVNQNKYRSNSYQPLVDSDYENDQIRVYTPLADHMQQQHNVNGNATQYVNIP